MDKKQKYPGAAPQENPAIRAAKPIPSPTERALFDALKKSNPPPRLGKKQLPKGMPKDTAGAKASAKTSAKTSAKAGKPIKTVTFSDGQDRYQLVITRKNSVAVKKSR